MSARLSPPPPPGPSSSPRQPTSLSCTLSASTSPDLDPPGAGPLRHRRRAPGPRRPGPPAPRLWGRLRLRRAPCQGGGGRGGGGGWRRRGLCGGRRLARGGGRAVGLASLGHPWLHFYPPPPPRTHKHTHTHTALAAWTRFCSLALAPETLLLKRGRQSPLLPVSRRTKNFYLSPSAGSLFLFFSPKPRRVCAAPTLSCA